MDSPEEPPAQPRPWRGRATLVGLIGVIVGAAAMGAFVPAIRAAAGLAAAIIMVNQPSQQSDPSVEVYNKLSPSIVLVRSTASEASGFYDQTTTATDYGSGIIFNASGYIVTNDHVINGGTAITVTLNGGLSYPATVVGTDPSTDLAVLKIAPPPSVTLTPAVFAHSNAVVAGEPVYALGNPLGPQFPNTLTSGVVSAIRPMLYGLVDDRVTEMIQTSAPINPGNSGGALANSDAEVIGITSMKVTQTGESNVPAIGLGFAIPSDTVQMVVDQILQYGYVHRPYIGISIDQSNADVLPTQAEQLTVAEVAPGSPAAAAGLEVGDVLKTWQGVPILNYYQLVVDLNAATIGETVDLGVLQNDEPVTITLTLGLAPEASSSPAATTEPPASSMSPFPFGAIFPAYRA